MNTAHWVALALQEVLQSVRSLFGLNEYQSQCVNWKEEKHENRLGYNLVSEQRNREEIRFE